MGVRAPSVAPESDDSPTKGGKTMEQNTIEENLVSGSTFGIYFEETGNFYANNRASQNTTNYMKAPSSGSPGNGGGNAAF